MELNKEEVLQVLQNFEERGSETYDKLPDVLEEYLSHVAKTGDVLFPWVNVKPLLRRKVQLVLDEFHEKHPLPITVNSSGVQVVNSGASSGSGSNAIISGGSSSSSSAGSNQCFNYDELRNEILSSLDSFTGAPFTIQRICELLATPMKHYKRTDKFMRGLEKNVLVVSHVDPVFPNHGNDHGHHHHHHHAHDDLSPRDLLAKSIFSNDSPYMSVFADHHRSSSNDANTPGPSSSSMMMKMDSDFSSSSSRSRTDQSSNFMSQEQAGSSSSSSSSNNNNNKIILPSLSPCPNPGAPAPLQQLDSFTTVFSSPPSTPLAVVSNMPPFDPTSSSSSSSSSSGSSEDSSPQPADHCAASPEIPENTDGHSGDARSAFPDSHALVQGNEENQPPVTETLMNAAAGLAPLSQITSSGHETEVAVSAPDTSGSIVAADQPEAQVPVAATEQVAFIPEQHLEELAPEPLSLTETPAAASAVVNPATEFPDLVTTAVWKENEDVPVCEPILSEPKRIRMDEEWKETESNAPAEIDMDSSLEGTSDQQQAEPVVTDDSECGSSSEAPITNE